MEQQKALESLKSSGGFSGESGDMMRLLELQKAQMQGETERMKNFMQDFMDQMINMQGNNMTSNNVHGSGFDRRGGNQN